MFRRVSIPLRCVGLLLCVGLTTYAAKLPWLSKAPADWTAAEVDRVLSDSPWAQPSEATFPDPRDHDAIPAQNLPGPEQAGMAGHRGVSDGRWDGGVGVNHGAGLPTLRLLIRWETAEPIREARTRLRSLAPHSSDSFDLSHASDEYVISITGLVPSNQVKGPVKLSSQSSSDDADAAVPKPDPERLLENFMSNSILASRNGSFVHPRNARLDPTSGTLYLFFPRSLNLTEKDKDAFLSTRYGSLIVKKRFHLGDMLYKKQLVL